ncbi:MAG: starch-binding protein [Treponema sp.]|nr:starch-binding protein [Treponema sp.]
MIKSFTTKVLGVVALLFISAFVLSCANSIESNNSLLLGLLLADSKIQEYGDLTINSAASRAMNISDISFAKAYVTGTGISTVIESDYSSAEGGTGNLTINKIPVGKNRIVTVYAYDSSKNKLGTVMLRAVTDIDKGDNSISVNQGTTAIANVFDSLLSLGYDISKIDTATKTSIESKIDSSKTWALINTAKIASDFSSSGINSLGSADSYILATGSVPFRSYYDRCSIQIGDPVSSIMTNVSAGEGKITDVAPGIWPVYVSVPGENVKKTYVTVKAGEESRTINLGTVTDRIIVHCSVSSGYKNIYAWVGSEPSVTKLFGEWPGTAMTDSDGDGWYDVEISETSCNLIFNGNGQTGNLSRETGEWWYKDGTWYAENPDDSEAPELLLFTSDKSGNVSGKVTFSLEAADNLELSKAVITLDGSTLNILKLSGKTSSVIYSWETAYYPNGSHVVKAVVYDAAGNISEEKSLSFTTSNVNLPPVAVISGTTAAKIDSEKTYSASKSYDQNGGTIASYSWTVTGAAIVSGQGTNTLTVKMPSTETTVTIKLTVKDSDGAGSETVSKEVKVISGSQSFDFREETIYFVMTTRFYDGDSSNNVHCWDENAETPANDPAWRGDFKGLIQKLDYIKALGFSAVWITPIVENCSGLDYHGYHAMNFQKVDPRYESSDVDFQTLIDEVHARDMKLVLDVVFNHTGNFGEANLAPMFEKDYSANLEDIDACLKLSANSLLDESYFNLDGDSQYSTRLKLMKNTDWKNHEKHNYYHHFGFGSWDDFSVQFFQMAGDCVDLNTENPKVLKYIVDSYSKYIEMGVDAFRIDTGKHMSRLEFNCYLNDAFKEAALKCGNDNFYMFTEICAKSSEVTYRGSVENLSPYFYTWKDDETYGFTMDDEDMYEGVIILPERDDCSNDEKDEQRVTKDLTYWTRQTEDGRTVTPVNSLAVQKQGMATHSVRSNRPTSNNHLLNGNTYHTPDYSNASGLSVIDFPMHWNFNSASGAFGVHGDDKLYNDATWNVVYVDSHDYGPSAKYEYRYDGGTDAWAENLDLMFTFRGIPCLYYGSEVEFQAGMPIDKGPVLALKDSGRAYYGDYLEGNVVASDFGEYSESGTTGTVKTTLEKPLCQHIMRLNKIRRAIPALQKGQYSTENCGSGGMAFKRRYTDSKTDSFVLVTISSDTTFTGLPGGTYVDAITGDTKQVSEGGSITTSGCTTGNMRIYVLNGPGKIGEDTDWLK